MQPKPKLPGPKGPAKPLPGEAPGAAGLRPAMARPGAGPRPAGAAGARPATARPYGHALPAPARGRPVHRFLMLGIPYLALNGLGLLVVLLLVLFLVIFTGNIATQNPGVGGGLAGAIAAMAVVVLVLVLLFLAYVIVAGILCIKGKVAGWWMAMAHSGLGAMFQVIGLLGSLSGPSDGGELAVGGIGLLVSGGLLTLGIFDMKAFKAKLAGRSGAMAATGDGARPPLPPPSGARPRGNTSVRMAPSVRMKQQAGPAHQAQAPVPLPQADTVRAPQNQAPAEPPAEPEPRPAGPPPNATNPKAAAVQILALAANVEPDLAPARLEKARAAATRLLGEGSRADMDAWMASPLPVSDVAAQMADVSGLVGGNAKLAQGVIKCAQYALKDADGSYTEAALSVLATLQQQFPAPAPPPPPVVAPAPPPIQTAPPPVYAPPPPPAGIAVAPPPAAPGVALPRQRRRRPGYR